MFVLVIFNVINFKRSFRIDKKFYKPSAINQFVVVVYERKERFNPRAVEDVIRGLVSSCRDVGRSQFRLEEPGITVPLVGIKVPDNAAAVQWENGQGVIANVSVLDPLSLLFCSFFVVCSNSAQQGENANRKRGSTLTLSLSFSQKEVAISTLR
jgi:hypothetical protein